MIGSKRSRDCAKLPISSAVTMSDDFLLHLTKRIGRSVNLNNDCFGTELEWQNVNVLIANTKQTDRSILAPNISKLDIMFSFF